MGYMFRETSAFNQPIGQWDVSKVTNMQYMFYSASVFNQPIGQWDVSKVTNMQYMFQSARCVCAKPRKLAGDDVYSCDELVRTDTRNVQRRHCVPL